MTATKNRVIRIPDDVWDSARTTTAQAGETITAVVTRALIDYVAHPPVEGSMRVAESFPCPRCGIVVKRQRPSGGAALARHHNTEGQWCE